MNFKVTLVLLVLVLAGFAAYLWVDKHPPADVNNPAPDAKQGTELWAPSARFNSEKVASVTIETGGKSYIFAQDAAPSLTSANESAPQPQWNQTKPVTFPVNGYRINALVADIYGLRYTVMGMPGEKNLPTLADAGLSPAKATITLAQAPEPASTKPATEKQTTMTLKIGNTVGIGGAAYVMINDDPHLFVVRDDVHKAVNKPNFDEFRQTTLVAPVEGRASHVTLERVFPDSKQPLAVAMTKNDGRWSFDAPLTGRVDKDQVSALLSAVSSFFAGNFISEDASRLPIYGLDQPTITLTASAPAQSSGTGGTPSAESRFMLRIGNAADLTRDNFYATWSTTPSPSPVVFTVTKSVVDTLSKTADALRDKRVAPVSASDVVQLQIEHPGSTVGFSKSPTGWSFSPLNPLFTTESSAVTKIVDSITSLNADSFTQAPAGDKPFATIKLTATGRPEPDVIRLYTDEPLNPKPKNYTAYRNNENVGYVIPAEKFAPVFIVPTDVRSLTALSFAADDVTRVTLVQPDHAAPLEFERAAGVWKLVGHDKFESSAFDSMVRTLLPLKAEQWLGEPASALAKGDIVLTLQRASGAPITLTIDSATRRANVSTDAALFKLAANIVSKTQEEFLDRNVLPINGSDVTALTITDQAGKACEVVRDPTSGFIAIDGRKFDAGVISKIVDTAAGLRVEKYREAADPSPVVRTITLTTSKGDKATLTLRAGNRASLTGKIAGTDVERHFQLDAASVKAFQAPLTGKAEPNVREDM
jgi:hypothetical protein